MDEDTSPAVEEVVETPATETPEADPILSALETQDDDTPSVVDETPAQEEAEPESPAEDEQEDQEEDLQPESDPKEEARRRYEERQREREARRNEFNQFAEQKSQEIREGAEDEYDQRLKDIEARDMEREVERYVERIENNENQLVNEYERVKANPDLQIFNRDNPQEFNEKAYNKAIKDFNAGYVQEDQFGNIVSVRGSLFEHLTETADLLRGAQKSGAVQQVRAARQMRENADITPAATPKEPQKDVTLEILKSDD